MSSPLSQKWTLSFRNWKGPATGLSGSAPEGLWLIYVLESMLSALGPPADPIPSPDPLMLFLPNNGLCSQSLVRAGEMGLKGEAQEGEGTHQDQVVVSDHSVMRIWCFLLSSYTVDS